MQNGFAKEKLKTILIDYFDKIRDKNVSESTVRHERTIQAKTIPKFFPIPKAENILDDMNEADVYTVIALKSSYWHILLMKVINIRLHLWYPMQSTSGEFCRLA